MRILILNDYTFINGGSETFIYQLKKELEKRGHIVKVLGCNHKGGIRQQISRFFSIYWYIKVSKTISVFKPDVIHVNNFARVISPSVIKAAADKKVPIILTLHDINNYCPKMWGIYSNNKPCQYGFGIKCLFSNCRTFKEGNKYFFYNIILILKIAVHRFFLKRYNITFVSPSHMVANYISKSLNVKVKIIRNGISVINSKKIYKRIILFVGRLSKEKGLLSVCNVLNNIRDYKIIILGEGPLKNELRKKFKNIDFLGFKNPQKYYKTASIVVVPSICLENFSYSVLEGMSNGLCVVASRIGGIPEQIKHMKTGVLFKSADELDFNRKIRYLLNNRNEILRIGKNAKIFSDINFTWHIIAKEYERTYISSIKQVTKENIYLKNF